jgi:hypothetical protein
VPTRPSAPLPPPQAANALTFDELQSLTYLQVKGSGIANTCPVLSTGSTNLKDLKSGSYKLERFCMEPTSFSVKEESQFKGGESGFTKTKLMTRLTYTLDGVRSGTGQGGMGPSGGGAAQGLAGAATDGAGRSGGRRRGRRRGSTEAAAARRRSCGCKQAPRAAGPRSAPPH